MTHTPLRAPAPHAQRSRLQVLGPALAVLVLLPAAAHAVTLTGRVTDVVDGDTVKVEARGFETVVRLIGVDTPETRKPNTPVQCFGPQASERTHRLLPVGQRVTLITDPTQQTRARYGRLLAYVYWPGRTGLQSVNYALVATGYAKAYVYEPSGPFQYAPQFLGAERQARNARRGLWGPPCRGNTTQPDPGALPAPAPAPTTSTPTTTAPRTGCDPAYPTVCIAPAPPDLDCADVPYRNFRVLPPDPHHFDGGGDGVGCEE